MGNVPYLWLKTVQLQSSIPIIEKDISEFIQWAARFLAGHEIPFPVLVLISFLNVKDYSPYIPKPLGMLDEQTRDWCHVARNIDRDHLFLPDILIEDSGADIRSALSPAFDGLWNACGIPHSLTKS